MKDVAAQILELARPVGRPHNTDLIWSNFANGSQTADSAGTGIPTPVGLYRVPAGVLLGLLPGVPFRLVIRGHGQFTTVTGGTQQVLDMTTVGFTEIAQLPQGTSVYVWETTGGVTTALAITSVDYANATITVTPTTTGSTLDAYAPPIKGHAELQVVLPTAGLGGINVPIWSEDFAVLHQIQQSGNESAPKLDSQFDFIPLAPRWQLGIYVDTPVTVEWVANAKQRVHLHGKQRQVRPTPQDAAQLEAIWLAAHRGM